jgi:short repeat uncharacterized protein DUF308
MPALPAAEATGERKYCRFGKRNLDGMSWLAPLVSNRFGDRLNLELRHEQLFFIKGDQVIEDIGYSEKGQRFTEAQFGKPIHSLEDLKRNGYWLVGQEYDPAVMREALAEQKDGYYYLLFANQSQDWADRLRRSAERLETQRGVQPGHIARSAAPHYSKPVSPTEPASIWMGLVAVLLGGASIVGPIVAGDLFTVLVGIVFLVSGASHIAYGLHAKDWRNFIHFLLLAVGLFAGGILILMNLHFAVVASGTLLAILIAIQGVNSIHRRRGQPAAHPRTGTSGGGDGNAGLRRLDCLALAREQRRFRRALGRDCFDCRRVINGLAQLDDSPRRRLASSR